KDLDIFCKPSDYTSILQHFKRLGYAVEIEDERWIAKVFRGEHFFDLIFASWHGAMPVSDRWFDHAPRVEIFGMPVRVIAPPELFWPKAFVQLRHRYDGADIVHLILKQHGSIGDVFSITWPCTGKCCWSIFSISVGLTRASAITCRAGSWTSCSAVSSGSSTCRPRA